MVPLLETSRGTLFYAERGTGDVALLCVHGAGGSHQHWGLQLRNLSNTARVIVLDLPGHGRSPGAGHTTIADYSAVLVAALDALALERGVVAGHSMGGAVALWSALHTPERVAGLVLVGTGAKLPVLPVLFTHMQQGNHVAAVRLIVERGYARSASPDLQASGEAAFLQTDPDVFAGDLQACDGYSLMTQLGAITCPALVVCGTEDRITPPKFSHLLHDTLPNATITMIPHAGHMVLIEQPHALNQAIRHFLAQL